MIRSTLGFSVLAAALAGCTTGSVATSGAGETAAKGPAAHAELRGANGASHGMAHLQATSGGLMMHVEATGLPLGVHGIHVHTVGKCDAPDFQTAGGHWNPTSRQHGAQNPQGAHTGDLPNITIGQDGRGMLHQMLPGASLNGGANNPLDADGSAIVIHATADDYRTDPSGNSGGRIACGVLRPM